MDTKIHLTSKMAFKTKKLQLNIDIFEIKFTHSLIHSLTHSLPDYSCLARGQTENHTANGMCFLGFRQVCALCTSPFIFSSADPYQGIIYTFIAQYYFTELCCDLLQCFLSLILYATKM